MSRLKPFFIMENQKEIWKDIPNYEGYYQVSNLGRVKSVKRIIYRSDGKIQTFKEKILKQADSGRGYLVVNLCVVGVQKVLQTHQLVAMAFLNHNPKESNMVVDHINNIRSDNTLRNLQVITTRHNLSKDKKGYTSKYIGVSYYKRNSKWRSGIMINGKKIHLGLFDTEIEASIAYQEALKGLTNVA